MSSEKVEMEYRQLGNTGIKVSVIGYGNGINDDPANFDRDFEIVKFLTDNGVNFLDTAEQYGDGKAEIQLGKILKKLGKPREELVITTKIFNFGNDVNSKGSTSRKHLIEGTLASLKRLQLDYVDILYCHRFDQDTPIEEVVRAMSWLINNNKAFYWGTSEWSPEQLKEAIGIADRLGLHRPAVEQPQYNMFERKRMELDYKSLFDNFRIGTTIWSPLAGGVLTGRYNDGIVPNDSRFSVSPISKVIFFDPFFTPDKIEKTKNILKGLAQIAKELGCTQPQLALAWVIKNKDVSTAITGASKLDQAKDSIQALKVQQKLLTPEVEERIEKLLDNRPQPEMNWKTWVPFPPRR